MLNKTPKIVDFLQKNKIDKPRICLITKHAKERSFYKNIMDLSFLFFTPIKKQNFIFIESEEEDYNCTVKI